MIHIGTTLLGHVDEIPGLFYVKTKFLHFNFILLIPMQSYVIRAGTETKDGGAFLGESLGWYARSILAAYLRASLFVVMAIGLAGTLITGVWCWHGADWWHYLTIWIACSMAGAGLLYGSFRWLRPNAARAVKLAMVLGITPEELAEHCVGKHIHFVRPNTESKCVGD